MCFFTIVSYVLATNILARNPLKISASFFVLSFIPSSSEYGLLYIFHMKYMVFKYKTN